MGEHDLDLTLAEVGSAAALAHDAHGEQKSQRVGVRLVEVGGAGDGQSQRALHGPGKPNSSLRSEINSKVANERSKMPREGELSEANIQKLDLRKR
jgi:hypothetical protein